MNTITVSIHYFGAFRSLGEGASVDVPIGSSVDQVKQALIQFLGVEHQGLVEASVLANETDILSAQAIIRQSSCLSIMPPVCGG